MGELRQERPRAGVALMVLDRPDAANALSISLRDEVTAALATLVDDPDVRVIAVTGAGRHFCAGFDLGEFEANTGEDAKRRLWESSDAFHRAWLECALPTVAIVNGPALGGGFDLATMCDVRVAGESAWFAHPEHAFIDPVFSPLHDLVGGSMARYLTLTGRRLGVRRAHELGLVGSVHPDAELREAGLDLCADIAKGPREALVRSKAKARARAGITLGDRVGATLDL
ncbi:enoyl-CoA hydratase/isomerase family protein [Pseudonocardia acaciae]|uniref:enoyl-CoA hydratase/isomerase family protein n=1 Tax=Pseudonocardia acaciae TaxID=551276 RepID=UPI0006888A70|nr:enoyl-CoA hydratase/isomerase family protein [Pseudonocardia acaciae]